MPSLPRHLSLLAAIAVLTLSCNAAYYAAWEKLGKHKRDLLRDNVEDARDAQGEASEHFQDALTRLREMYAVDGGELEEIYDRLEADYESATDKAEAVRGRINRVEAVAADLFAEWESEIELLSSAKLKASSREKLRITRRRYGELERAMKRAEATMEPVLVQFRDQVLFLKHNLNAKAVGSLQGEVAEIEADVTQLLDEMRASIREADAFLKELPQS